jgi:hypothetical protein
MCTVNILTGKTFSREQKRAAFEQWKAKVSLREIRDQLQISEAILRRILTIAETSPDDPGSGQKTGSRKKAKSTATLRGNEGILMKKTTMTARKLKISCNIMNNFLKYVFMSFSCILILTAQFHWRQLYT